MSKNKYLLIFDNRQPFGSREHFFHFAWGYLFPALYTIQRIETRSPQKPSKNTYLFQSCGPVMNEVLIEMLKLHGYEFSFIDNDKMFLNARKNTYVPRWDVWLEENCMEKNFWRRLKGSKKITSKLFKSSMTVKRNALEKLDNFSIDETLGDLKEKYLILRRSSQNPYYEKGGRAEIPTYGTARRELLGINEALAYLQSKGTPVEVFEPGKYSFKEQIIVFQNCKGVIGIKGAEFANLLWMKQGSEVIQIRPSIMKTNNIQESLARLLELDFREIVDTAGGFFPTLKGEVLLEYLKP